MFYETEHNEHGLAHDPFKALVSPRPIGWISTRAADGTVNLSPYSFFNAVSDRPKLVMFSSSGLKHSAANAIESGEFVCNLATASLARALNRSSAPAPRGVSEFEIAGLTQAACRLVAAPRVLESPAALECRVTEWLQPKNLAGTVSDNVVVIGQVVGVHISEAILQDGRVRMELAEPLSRLGYMDYAVTRDVFELFRPVEPDASDLD